MNAVGLRVLVIEDDVFIGLLLGEMLAELGHEVCGLERTEAGAVAAALRHLPDLLIVDAQLAKGSGIAAVAQIWRSRPVPYLFISGGSRRALGAEAIMLEKPFDDSALARAIDQVLALHRHSG
jgi:CheY-like chemotaxis protein